MKFKLLAVTAAVGATLITGCATQQHSADSVSKSKYDSEMAKRDAELATLRKQVSSGSGSATNNTNTELFPPNPKPGHCYARLLTPATYKTSSEKVVVREASESVKVIPATYKNSQERVLVREASTQVKVIPETYKKVTEKILVKEASSKLVAVPATYGKVTEKVLDKAAHTVWKRGSGFQSAALQTSYDQSTGEIMCLVEVPATYKTITKTVLKSPATTKTVEIPAVYKTVTKTVIDKPASTKKVTIPAEYKTIDVKKVATKASEKRVAIPAEYGTVEKRKKITEEKLSWDSVICEENVNNGLISRLQQSLTKGGYYKGPIDGAYGSMTRDALNKFSSAKNIAKSGTYIPLKTAELLGVKL